MFAIAAAIVLYYGIRGYFVEAIVRIGYSVYQVGAVLACIVFVTIIDVLMARDWDMVFHLASAVSAECEADFELGLRANLDATRATEARRPACRTARCRR